MPALPSDRGLLHLGAGAGPDRIAKMESTTPPAWVEFILAQMDKRFDQQDAKLEKLVTRDTFRDEQSRVNDLIRDIQKDVSENRASIQAEATARANSELVRTQRERDEAEKRQAIAKQTSWQWFAIPASALAAYIIPWLLSGGMAQ